VPQSRHQRKRKKFCRTAIETCRQCDDNFNLRTTHARRRDYAVNQREGLEGQIAFIPVGSAEPIFSTPYVMALIRVHSLFFNRTHLPGSRIQPFYRFFFHRLWLVRSFVATVLW